MFSVHLDLQCPDCLMAWDALKQMADHYERSVKLSIVDFPLPYHRAAFKGKYQSQSLLIKIKNLQGQVQEWNSDPIGLRSEGPQRS